MVESLKERLDAALESAERSGRVVSVERLTKEIAGGTEATDRVSIARMIIDECSARGMPMKLDLAEKPIGDREN